MYAPSPRSHDAVQFLLAAEMEFLLIELLDGSVVEVDGDGGDEGEQRGLVGGVIPGEVADSKTGFTLGCL